MTIACFFALDAESAPWRDRQPVRWSGDDAIYQGELATQSVRVASIGVGAQRLDDVAAARLLDGTAAALALGLAGALQVTPAVGRVVAARTVQAAGRSEVLRGDPRLLALAARSGAAIAERLLSADHVIATAAEKALWRTAADMVDMESFSVLAAAASRGVPAVAVRVIGDAADEDLPIDFARALRADGTLDFRRVAGDALRNPARWPAFLRFGVANRRALRTLAAFLDRFVPSIGDALAHEAGAASAAPPR